MTKKRRRRVRSQTRPVTRYTFRMGAVFSPDDEVAMFLVSFTASLNDLLYANRLLVPEKGNRLLRKDPTPSENLYLIRLVAGHVWEALLLLRDASERPAIKSFLEGLVPPGPERYVEAMAAATDKNDGTYKTLALLRNHSWHYPRPDNEELLRAVAGVAAEEGQLEVGEFMPSIRGVFADGVFAKMLFRYSGDDREALGRIVHGFAKTTVALVHLAQVALDDHLGRVHGDKVTRE